MVTCPLLSVLSPFLFVFVLFCFLGMSIWLQTIIKSSDQIYATKRFVLGTDDLVVFSEMSEVTATKNPSASMRACMTSSQCQSKVTFPFAYLPGRK